MSDFLILGEPLIDWVTLSVTGSAFYRMRQMLQQDSAYEDKKYQRRRFGGNIWYEGYATKEYFFGERENEGTLWGIFVSEGYISDYWAKHWWHAGLGDQCKCTRIDYQITLKEPEWYEPINFLTSLEDDGVGNAAMDGMRKSGRTVALGSRTSARYTRVYQKVADSDGGELRALRYEMEFKREVADFLWRQKLTPGDTLAAEIDSVKLDGRRYAARVLSEFRSHLDDGGAGRISISRVQSSTMKWLDNQVRAGIMKVINGHDSDDRDLLKGWLKDWLDVIEIKEMERV